VIGFQDAFAKVELDNTLGGKLSLFGVYGSSYNDHAVEDSVEVFKDGLDIRYDANIFITGANHISNDNRFSNSLVYSTRTDKRLSSKPEDFLPNVDLVNSRSDLRESRLSLHSKYLVSSKLRVGLKASNFIFDPDAQITPELSLIDRLSYVDFHPYVNASFIQKEQFSLDAKVGAYYETAFNEFSVTPALSAKYLMSCGLAFAFNYSLTTQMQAPELYQASGIGFISNNSLRRSNGHHFRLGISKGDLTLSGFYHHLYDLATSSAEDLSMMNDWFSDLSNLDVIPNSPLGNFATANILGASVVYEKAFKNAYYLSGNISYIDSKSKNSLFRVTNSSTAYDFGSVINLRLQKKIEFDRYRYLNISTAFHYRGGARENSIDLISSRQAGRTIYEDRSFFEIKQNAYHRLDLRISYVKKKSKNNKYKSVISMDIQNLYGRQNDAYNYYDPFTDQIELQNQLGTLPVLSYRLEF